MNPEISAEAAEILRGGIVFCGFSGGSDSLYLLLALNECSAPFHFELRAVHFNHGLRGAESDADEAWCREKCAELAVPFLSVPLDVGGRREAGEGDEAAARRLRLEAWKRLCRETPGAVVALGHQADDRTENLLLRLFRGSNATGLTSMRLHSVVDGVEFVRPLLHLSRSDMEAELRRRGEAWRTDSTNRTDCYGRNFLRLNLIPMLANRFPFAPGGLRRSLEVLEQDADCLEREAHRVFAEGLHTPHEWASLHPAIRCRALRYFLNADFPGFVPDSALTERFSAAVASPPENGECVRIPLAGFPDCAICVESGRVFPHRFIGFAEIVWNLKETPEIRFGDSVLTAELVSVPEMKRADAETVFFSADLPHVLHVGSRRDGDRMVPFGKHHPVPLKKLYSDCGIKSYSRDAVPVLRTSDGAVLWAAGVRRSALFPVAPDAETVWRIQQTLRKSGHHT